MVLCAPLSLTTLPMAASYFVIGWKGDVGDVTGATLVSTTNCLAWRLNVVLCLKYDVLAPLTPNPMVFSLW